jgi:hypothetical protein
MAKVTGKVNDAEVELLLLSVTFTVKVALTAVGGTGPGVLVSNPAGLIVSHAGSPVADQL